MLNSKYSTHSFCHVLQTQADTAKGKLSNPVSNLVELPLTSADTGSFKGVFLS